MVIAQTKNKIGSSIITRPPVVAVLGHVDHGKTTLLDYIRKSQLASKESGGITQHIGAYQVKIPAKGWPASGGKLKKKENSITFIDTPGHAAFCKLRSRGVKIADVAVLVVDAVDGVKPQTIESIDCIKEAEIPFLVAINKMDLPSASQEKIKTQLAEKGVLVEGWGGQIVSLPISGKTGQGTEELLEMILLMAEMQELKADLEALPQGVIIEARLDSHKGPVATLLVKDGIFKLGDSIIAGQGEGKIKAMFDENRKRVLQVVPSCAVEILGFKKLPEVGSLVKINNKKSVVTQSLPIAEKTPQTDELKLSKETNNQKKIKVILKADVTGSLEAIKDSLPNEILLILEGIGNVTESDILLARSTASLILAFRVALEPGVNKLADFEKVKIKKYDVIYRLLEDVQSQALSLVEPVVEEKVLGEAQVIAEFKMKGNHIAGCRVLKGTISKKEMVHIKRDDKLLATTRIKSLQIRRQDALVAKEKEEVGLIFAKDVDFAQGDVIISYCLH